MTMTNSYTAILKQDGKFWIGWVEEVPGVNAQETTKEALLASLKVILREALEFNREEARAAAAAGYIEEPIMI
jgi:predicted RNase H-like HicB family nuclease